MVTKATRCLALALISATQVFGQIDTIKTVDISVDEKGQSNEIDGAQLKTHLSENEFKKRPVARFQRVLNLAIPSRYLTGMVYLESGR